MGPIEVMELAISGKVEDENIQRMHDIEAKCDEVTHEIIYSLNKTFIMLSDREDIHPLAHGLDTAVASYTPSLGRSWGWGRSCGLRPSNGGWRDRSCGHGY